MSFGCRIPVNRGRPSEEDVRAALERVRKPVFLPTDPTGGGCSVVDEAAAALRDLPDCLWRLHDYPGLLRDLLRNYRAGSLMQQTLRIKLSHDPRNYHPAEFAQVYMRR